MPARPHRCDGGAWIPPSSSCRGSSSIRGSHSTLENDAPPTGLLGEITLMTTGAAMTRLPSRSLTRSRAPLDIRVWLDPLVDQSGNSIAAVEHLQLRQATRIPTTSGGMNADALPDLGDAGIVRMPPSSDARVWVTS